MTAKPKPVMANDWHVWLQDVQGHIVSITKSYIGDEVQFLAIVAASDGNMKRSAIRRHKSAPPIVFDIPVAGTSFRFVEAFHDLTYLPDAAYFRDIHEELAATAENSLATVQVEGNA